MRANQLLKHNIDTLLRGRHQSRRDLAQWCYKSESWLSKIFKETRREFSLKDLDRIAEFFGIATYQLFQPGISALTDRRSHLERRSVKDRRLAAGQRAMLDITAEVDTHHPRRKGAHVAASSPYAQALAKLAAEYARRIDTIMAAATHARHETTAPRKALPAKGKSRRVPSGSDAAKD